MDVIYTTCKSLFNLSEHVFYLIQVLFVSLSMSCMHYTTGKYLFKWEPYSFFEMNGRHYPDNAIKQPNMNCIRDLHIFFSFSYRVFCYRYIVHFGMAFRILGLGLNTLFRPLVCNYGCLYYFIFVKLMTRVQHNLYITLLSIGNHYNKIFKES